MKSLMGLKVFAGMLIMVLVFGAACAAPAAEVAEEPPAAADPVEEPSTDEQAAEASVEEPEEAEEAPADETDEEVEEAGAESLPPEPQLIPFLAADGFEHTGTYYPGTKNPGPLVILMHWAGGDETDWAAIAPWLQNRGLPGPENPAPERTWLDSSWFPELGSQTSFGVFTFTFRYCEGGCTQFDVEGWLQDAYGAMEMARQLPGVDPQQIVLIGASVGADGAVDACMDGCQGALSLSPGSYLGVDYAEAVTAAEELGAPVWCLAAEDDVPSFAACSNAEGDLYRPIFHPGADHGMSLIKPDTFDPDTMEVILEFLDLTLGL